MAELFRRTGQERTKLIQCFHRRYRLQKRLQLFRIFDLLDGYHLRHSCGTELNAQTYFYPTQQAFAFSFASSFAFSFAFTFAFSFAFTFDSSFFAGKAFKTRYEWHALFLSPGLQFSVGRSAPAYVVTLCCGETCIRADQKMHEALLPLRVSRFDPSGFGRPYNRPSIAASHPESAYESPQVKWH